MGRWAPAGALLFAAGVSLVARSVTWPAGQSVDDWAYAAWGQGLVRGQAPVIWVTGTAPKPLMHVLASAAVVLPADRGITIVVAVGGAALIAGVGLCALRLGGGLAMPVAVGSLLVSRSFGTNFQHGSVDAITAALLVWALALAGRWRVGMLVACGLMRPEAWPLAGVAAYLGSSGRRVRRLGIAVACGCAAPVIWAATDYALSDVPFVFVSVGNRIDTAEHIRHRTLSELPGLVSGSVIDAAGVPLVVLGSAGLIVNAIRSRRRGRFDPLPLAAVGVWSTVLTAEFFQRLPAYARYSAPLAAVLAIGAGLLAVELVPGRWIRLSTWPATLLTILITLAWVAAVPLNPATRTPRVASVEASLPTVQRLLGCGTLGVLSDSMNYPSKLIPITAVLGHIPLSDFAAVTPTTEGRYGAVIKQWNTSTTLRPGVRRTTLIGPISLTRQCAHKITNG